MKTVEELVEFAFEKLKELAVMKCRTKDDYETAFENVYMDFMDQMENK